MNRIDDGLRSGGLFAEDVLDQDEASACCGRGQRADSGPVARLPIHGSKALWRAEALECQMPSGSRFGPCRERHPLTHRVRSSSGGLTARRKAASAAGLAAATARANTLPISTALAQNAHRSQRGASAVRLIPSERSFPGWLVSDRAATVFFAMV
jgi:hypothetical protein